MGDPKVWLQLAGTLDSFDSWFAVFPGPKAMVAPAGQPVRDPFVEVIVRWPRPTDRDRDQIDRFEDFAFACSRQ